MIIGHHQLDARQPKLTQAKQKRALRGLTFSVGYLATQDLAPAIPVDAHCNQHRLRGHDAALAHFLMSQASRIRYGNGSSSRREANWARLLSRRLLIEEIAEAEKLWPHSSSVLALTSRAVLIAVGIDWDGRRQILSGEIANRESQSS
jgi:hypothetical protein